MHTVTVEIDDKEYEYFMNVYCKNHKIKILKDIKTEKSDT